MTEPFSKGATTRVSRMIKAPRRTVYAAFLDRDAIASWLAPETMTGRVHTFDPREGGIFRMSFTYQNPEDSQRGKTSEDTDTFEGRFVELVPDEKIVWVTEFESQDPGFAGEMRITFRLADAEGGTEVCVLCEDIPRVCGPKTTKWVAVLRSGSWLRSSSDGPMPVSRLNRDIRITERLDVQEPARGALATWINEGAGAADCRAG
jgi:uncharacterized protein YndB with AHSA1/START domain